MLESIHQSLFFNQPVLNDAEVVIHQWLANHSQGRRAVGGKLFLTNQRLLFVPNRMDVRMGGKALGISRADVLNVGTAVPHRKLGELFSGAWRSRLQIETTQRNSFFFVVNQLSKTIGQLELEFRVQQ